MIAVGRASIVHVDRGLIIGYFCKKSGVKEVRGRIFERVRYFTQTSTVPTL